MSDGEEQRYTATEAATLIGCSLDTVLRRARRLWGPRRRPGAHCRLTAAQVERLRQAVYVRRRTAFTTPG